MITAEYFQTIPLTEAERKLLMTLCLGMSAKEMAKYNEISPNTVKRRTNSVYTKLGVHSQAQAVLLAILFDLVDVKQLREIIADQFEKHRKPFHYASLT